MSNVNTSNEKLRLYRRELWNKRKLLIKSDSLSGTDIQHNFQMFSTFTLQRKISSLRIKVADYMNYNRTIFITFATTPKHRS